MIIQRANSINSAPKTISPNQNKSVTFKSHFRITCLSDLIGDDIPKFFREAADSFTKEDDFFDEDTHITLDMAKRHLEMARLYEEIERENNAIFRQNIIKQSKKISDKILALPGYNSSLLPFLTDRKPRELEYLYNLASKVDEQGEMRIPSYAFPWFADIPYDSLKLFEPILLSKGNWGGWNFHPKFVLNLYDDFNLHQIEFMSKLAGYKFNGYDFRHIAKGPCCNWDKIINKSREINELYGENLREISLYTNNDQQLLLRAEVLESDKKGATTVKEYFSAVDWNINPIEEEKLSTKVRTSVRNLHRTLSEKSCSITEEELKKIALNIYGSESYVDIRDIFQTLQRLTPFANYGALKGLSVALQKENITQIVSPLGINPIMNYFQKSKGLFELSDGGQTAKQAIFVTKDDLYTQELEETVKEIKKKGLTSKITFINLEGWSDGINLFGDDKQLEERAVNVIRRVDNVMRAKSTYLTFDDALDKVLNGEIKKRLNELGVNYKTIRLKAPATPGVILEQMRPIMPSETILGACIKSVAKHFADGEQGYETICDNIANYYSKHLNVFSRQNIVEDLRLINSKIDEFLKTKKLSRENLYCVLPDVPEGFCKSFELINKMYVDLFNIPPEKNIKIFSMVNLNHYPPNSTFVILDDIVGSGSSMLSLGEYVFCAERIAQDRHVIFAPIVATKNGIETMQDAINKINRNNIDKIITLEKNIGNYDSVADTFTEIADEYNAEIARRVFGSKGHGGGGLCTVFPYMTPDNNSTLATYIAKFFVPSEKCIKNKNELLPQIGRAAYFIDIYGKNETQVSARNLGVV